MEPEILLKKIEIETLVSYIPHSHLKYEYKLKIAKAAMDM